MSHSGGVGRWTRRFAVGSALATVALQIAFLCDAPRGVVAVIGVLGAVLPMTFGMGYLLFPSYVGRTLSGGRLPGVHLLLTYAAVGLLVGDALLSTDAPLAAVGALAWSVGVAAFVGTLLRTVLPAVASETGPASSPRQGRSTRLAALAIPVALGYLLVGTVGLLSAAIGPSRPLDATGPAVVHWYAPGVAALLVFALGCRLLPGFFHVTPPKRLSRTVVLCGAVAPGVLAANVWRPPWFLVGAALEFVAAAGYAGVVAVVVRRMERRRVGLYGIALGAAFGVVAVGAAGAAATGIGGPAGVAAHVPAVLDGFLLLTVVGYAYQFFPVTTGQFRGATERTALATILLLGVGTALLAAGAGGRMPRLRVLGAVLALAGAAGYAYLLTRRLIRF